jgi:2-isopropylmalate synthase
MADQLIIFDTTLRDGEQSPGASMTKDEKLRIARQLERLKVDVIEAGFRGQLQRRLRGGAGDRRRDQGVDRLFAVARQRPRHQPRRRGAEGRQPRAHPHLHRHLAAAHGEEAAHDARAGAGAGQAVGALRPQPVRRHRVLARRRLPQRVDFLCRVLEAVIAEGATTINVPDTVGYAVPELYGNFIKTLRERVPNSDKAIWSVHCHNDLGMAVANSLAGVKIGGARQVECTINGLGERAGNCSLEEVVMAVKTRKDYFGLELGIDTKHILPPAAWSARPPASWCSPTRRWWAPTPSPTPAASTRTAC